MRFSAAGLAEVLDGRLVGPDVRIDGVATNTAELHRGQLFVPFRDRRDGHEFIDDAIDAGAAAYLSDGVTSARGTAIVVANTARALSEIGHVARGRIDGHVVGITGSVGKTTVKDLTSAIFATHYVTQASHLSFNNEIGLPLTLANAPDAVEAVVCELGARGHGHIADLCAIARPNIGIITRIGLAHTEFFGTLEQVAVAKAELFEALPTNGLAALNGDDPMAGLIAERSGAPVIRFGTGADCEVVASDVRLGDQAQATFTLHSPWGSATVRLAVHGAHQVSNALGALCAGLWAGVPIDDALDAVAKVSDPPMRMNITTPRPGITLINDSYNANPTSTEAALDALLAIDAQRRIAVLGAMAELGPESAALHDTIARLADSMGISVVAFQTSAYGTAPVNDVAALLERLGGLRAGDAVLVKGSRASGMEVVAQWLSDGEPDEESARLMPEQ